MGKAQSCHENKSFEIEKCNIKMKFMQLHSIYVLLTRISGNISEFQVPSRIEHNRSTYIITMIGLDTICCKDLLKLSFHPESVIEYFYPLTFFSCHIEILEIPQYLRKIHMKALDLFPTLSTILIPEHNRHFINGTDRICYQDSFIIIFCKRNVQHLTLRESIKYIYSFSFAFSNIKHVTIPASLEVIGPKAFYMNASLRNIKFAKDSHLLKIHGSAFHHCIQLKSIHFPDSLVSIGKYSFYECYILEYIHFGSSLKIIKEGAFMYTKIKEILFPMSLNFIGKNSFAKTRLSKSCFHDINDENIVVEDLTYDD